MKITVVREVELEFDAVRVVAQPRYLDEDCPDFPTKFVHGDTIAFTIDLKGREASIRGWEGKAQEIHTKVCDCCSVYLLNFTYEVAKRENNYVPGFMPGNHYGDYLILNIADDGKITNWNATAKDFVEAFSEE